MSTSTTTNSSTPDPAPFLERAARLAGYQAELTIAARIPVAKLLIEHDLRDCDVYVSTGGDALVMAQGRTIYLVTEFGEVRDLDMRA